MILPWAYYLSGPFALAGCAANQWRSLHRNAGGEAALATFLLPHDPIGVSCQDVGPSWTFAADSSLSVVDDVHRNL